MPKKVKIDAFFIKIRCLEEGSDIEYEGTTLSCNIIVPMKKYRIFSYINKIKDFPDHLTLQGNLYLKRHVEERLSKIGQNEIFFWLE